jgi:4-aminobutyrate aminotransferase
MPAEPSTEDLIARDAAVFFHQNGSSPVERALRGVEGIVIEDTAGRRYIDLHGNTAHHIGFAHPRLIAALKAQLDALPFCPRRNTNEAAILAAEALAARWTGQGRAKVLFTTGGSDGIELALRLARAATRRSETISFEGSYHGNGFGALGLSSARLDPRLGTHLPGRHHGTPYWIDAGRALGDMRAAFARSRGGIAAVIAEPMRSNCCVPPEGFWPEMRALCDAHGALLIFDEICSGLGKTGRFFAHEHFSVAPDAVVLGKALGGGTLPIAAVVADAALDVAPDLALGHYTHEKNPLTCRAALTTLEIIADEGLVARAAATGAHAASRMAELAATVPGVTGGRGLGLLLAVALDGTRFDKPALKRLVQAAFAEGVSATTKQPSALGFSPPLVITRDEVDEALARIGRAVRAVL